MSTHGRSGVGRWRRGSVADQVVRGAPVPVLLVHADQTEVVATGHPQRILVPLDGSALAEGALPLALCLARLAHASLVLVRAVNRPGDLSTSFAALGPIVGAELGALDEERTRSYLAGVSQRLLHYGVPVATTVYRDSPADAILACATEERADLIVMTTHGCGGLGRWALGSVADRVLSAAAMPVLLVRSTVAGHTEEVMGHEEGVLTSHNAA
jgi:nucleotide-binding universal stress UspA family protein